MRISGFIRPVRSVWSVRFIALAGGGVLFLSALAAAPSRVQAAETCTPTFPSNQPGSPGQASVQVAPGDHFSFPNEAELAATLTQQADLFTSPSWDGRDLGYGIEDEKITAFQWAVDSECALWLQVLVAETTGWTPAYNVRLDSQTVRFY